MGIPQIWHQTTTTWTQIYKEHSQQLFFLKDNMAKAEAHTLFDMMYYINQGNSMLGQAVWFIF